MRRTLLTIGFATLLVLSTSADAFATHFRYGHLRWKARPDLTATTAEFTLINAFRRDGYAGSGDDGHPVIGDVFSEFIGIDPALDFGDGTRTGRLDYVVIAVDATANWLLGRALADPNNVGVPLLHDYPGPGPWTAQVDTCCRIRESRNAPEGPYRIATTVDFASQGSPTISVPPIVNVAAGSPPIALAGGGFGHTFWRVARSDESGGLEPPPGINVVSPPSGFAELVWDTAGLDPGLYSIQLVLEDHDRATGALRTQSAVDFLLNLMPGNAAEIPSFVGGPSNLRCGSIFDWVADKPLEFDVLGRRMTARVGTLISLGLPTGATTNPLLPLRVEACPWCSTVELHTSFSWTPTAAQAGLHAIVFVLTNDDTGLQGQCSAIVQVKADTDGDGLPDDWELHGYDFQGQHVSLPGADPNHKDVYLRLDYMDRHQPDQTTVIDKVVDAFAVVPNSLVNNPNGLDGITLHVSLGTQLPHASTFGSTTQQPSGVAAYNWGDFDAVKRANFPEELWLSHHYGIFVHDAADNAAGERTDGIARRNGQQPSFGTDFIVSLADRPAGFFGLIPYGEGGTPLQQAAALMHELGHTLGLAHGGPIEGCPFNASVGDCLENFKPNYLSVMNYSFSLTGLYYNGSDGWIDYSRFTLPPLDELHLYENVGASRSPSHSLYGTKWFADSCLYPPLFGNAWDITQPINWNCNPFVDLNVTENINNLDTTSGRPTWTTLLGASDWDHLNYRQGIIGAGIGRPEPEETVVEEASRDDLSAIPPFPPQDLRVSIAACVARVSWKLTGPAGEYLYRVSRAVDAGAFSLLASTLEASVTDPQVSRDHGYRYYAVAVNTAGTDSPPTATATLPPILDQLMQLIALVQSQHLAPSFESGLVTGVQLARDSVARGNVAAACRQITAFANKVRTLSGTQLTPEQAAALLAAADPISGLLCCAGSSPTP